jgi:hypothetical protein
MTQNHLPEPAVHRLQAAAFCEQPVQGLTHGFYRYPARFSPGFARAAIAGFTAVGDLVLDPFMGGGTTLVEARALGRLAIGCDISELATFISEAKTTPFQPHELRDIENWITELSECIAQTKRFYSEAPDSVYYTRHLNNPQTYRIRDLLHQAILASDDLPLPKQRRLVRCSLLRTGQWSLDCRIHTPKISDVRTRLLQHLTQTIDEMREYSLVIRRADLNSSSSGVRRTVCLNREAESLAKESVFKRRAAPKLILTSPPYPGIHVLYHRWQVDGKKEAPAPFWIAGQSDGYGSSYYTLGDYRSFNLEPYYDRIENAFTAIRPLLDEHSVVIQLVGFGDHKTQLPRYLKAMNGAGYTECLPKTINGRIWRTVPNRKFYAGTHVNERGEVVLFHRVRP